MFPARRYWATSPSPVSSTRPSPRSLGEAEVDVVVRARRVLVEGQRPQGATPIATRIQTIAMITSRDRTTFVTRKYSQIPSTRKVTTVSNAVGASFETRPLTSCTRRNADDPREGRGDDDPLALEDDERRERRDEQRGHGGGDEGRDVVEPDGDDGGVAVEDRDDHQGRHGGPRRCRIRAGRRRPRRPPATGLLTARRRRGRRRRPRPRWPRRRPRRPAPAGARGRGSGPRLAGPAPARRTARRLSRQSSRCRPARSVGRRRWLGLGALRLPAVDPPAGRDVADACSAARLTRQKKAGNDSSLFARPAGRAARGPVRPRP